MYFLLGFALSSAAAQNVIVILKQVVDITPTKDIKQLIHNSIMIAFGRFDTEHQKLLLGKRVEGGELVNYVQKFHVEEYLKGTGPRFLPILSTGFEPLPDPKHPLKKVYPGPMAERDMCVLLNVWKEIIMQLLGADKECTPFTKEKQFLWKVGWTSYPWKNSKE